MSRLEEQPGLEVVDIPSGLEPSASHSDVLQGDPWMVQAMLTEPNGAGETIPKDEVKAHDRTENSQNRRRLLLWIVVAVVAILVIVGAVVGGVVGSRASKSHNSTTLKTNSSILRENSPLAVTGWELGGKTNTQLFWQGKDNAIYYSAWDSGHNSWAAPVKTDVSAAPGSNMAAGVIYQSPTQDVRFIDLSCRRLLTSFRAAHGIRKSSSTTKTGAATSTAKTISLPSLMDCLTASIMCLHH